MSLVDLWLRLDDGERREFYQTLNDVERRLIAANIPTPMELDPAEFVAHRLGENLWSKQREILRSVRDNRRTIVHSCHGVGKSFTAARAVAWWVETKPNPLVVTSAPSQAQVRGILWRELGRAHAKGDLSGRCNMTVWMRDGAMVAFGRKPAEADLEDVFQGMHSQNLLVVLDEAGGIPAGLWTAATKLVTNTNSRLLAIGNPDEEGSAFHRQAQNPKANTIHISAFDSPNFTDEEVTARMSEELVDQAWIDDLIDEFGEDSPEYKRQVLGEFVIDSTAGVIPRSWALDARGIGLNPVGEKVVGIDPSGGGDRTALCLRQGPVALAQFEFREPDPLRQARRVAEWLEAVGADVAIVDKIGIGHHLVGHLQELTGIHVYGMSVAEKSSNPDMWPNQRSELWWRARLSIKAGEWDLSNINDETIDELSAPRYLTDSRNRIVVEPKKETVKRIGSSPDLADALLLAFYQDHRYGTDQASTGEHIGRLVSRPQLHGSVPH